MPGDEFRKKLSDQVWRPGARAVSAFMDAAADAKAKRAPTFESPAVDDFRQAGIVKVLNLSGAPVPRFGVLGISGPVCTPETNLLEFQRQVALAGVLPAAAQAGNFAVMLDSIPAGAVGRGVVSGIVPCQIKATGVSDFADLLPGDATQLQQQPSGSAQIVWLDPAATVGGTFWAIVRLGPSALGFTGCSLTQHGTFLGTPPSAAYFVWTFPVAAPFYDSGPFLPVQGSSIQFLTTGYYLISISCGVSVPAVAGACKAQVLLFAGSPAAYGMGETYLDGDGISYGAINGSFQGRFAAGQTCQLVGAIGPDSSRLDVTFASGSLQIAKIG